MGTSSLEGALEEVEPPYRTLDTEAQANTDSASGDVGEPEDTEGEQE